MSHLLGPGGASLVFIILVALIILMGGALPAQAAETLNAMPVTSKPKYRFIMAVSL